jgi:UDP-N-acetylmuramyl tripeptide synthase
VAGAKLRLRAAVALGKTAAGLSRRLQLGGGTTLPGDVALWVDPGVLRTMAGSVRVGTVLVTGTNGKTSTAALLRTILAGAGSRVGGNPSGSNLIFGLTAAALELADSRGRIDRDWLVLEVDELTAPRAVAEIRPQGLVVLNAFRDQLDRSFEVDQIAQRLSAATAALAAGSFWVGNADDPRVAAMAEAASAAGAETVLFGLEAGGRDHLPIVSDSSACPRCRRELDFAAVFYAHCGRYQCPGCGFRRPQPQVVASHIQLPGLGAVEMTLSGPTGWTRSVNVRLGGVFSAANVAAAAATASAMGVSPDQVASGLTAFEPAFGRFQVRHWRGVPIRLLLAKNPAGLEENLAAALELDQSPVIAMGLNDGIADGRDVSWIWDVEMERLRDSRPVMLVVSGRRAHELALRLAYAGVQTTRVVVCESPRAALDQVAALAAPGVPVPALLTYTAMLEWHRLLGGLSGREQGELP